MLDQLSSDREGEVMNFVCFSINQTLFLMHYDFAFKYEKKKRKLQARVTCYYRNIKRAITKRTMATFH